MRWTSSPVGAALALALALLAPAACKQTIVIDESPGDGGSGGGPGDAGAPPDCSGPTVKLVPESPEVIVVLDRSSDMNSKFGDSSAVAAARETLNLYAMRYQNFVLFGYMEFPGADSFCNSQTCCASTPSLPSPSYTAFDMALNACKGDPPSCPVPTSQHPMLPALQNAATSFSRSDFFNHYLLLITNGLADCGATQGGNACTQAQMVVQQLRKPSQFNINAPPVFTTVIVPASFPIQGNTATCLQGIAVQGAVSSNNLPPPYYRLATTPAELTDTLGQVMKTIAMDACTLDQAQSPGQSLGQMKSDSLMLKWNGTAIPFDRNNGWDVNDNGFDIDLHGHACDQFLTGGTVGDLRLQTGCQQAFR